MTGGRKRILCAWLVTAAWMLGPAACGDGGESGPSGTPSEAAEPAPKPASQPQAVSISAEARSAAEEIFESRCVTCHGPQGAGDGPASAGLEPKPRNFQDPEWQDSVTDDHIEKIILYGGAAVGRSAAMPANPDLIAKPEVVAALREYVRGLGKR